MRVIGFFALLILVAAGAVTIAARRFVTSDRLKAIVVSQLQDTLKRPVQIQDVTFLLHKGIRIRGLRVLEGPGFPAGDWITSDVVLAKYKWSALLQRRLELDAVRLVSPRIRLLRSADGKWNIEDIFAGSAKSTSTTSMGWLTVPSMLTADTIGIDKGMISLNDFGSGRVDAIQDLDLTLHDFNLTRPFGFNASLQNTGELRDNPFRLRCSVFGTASLAAFQWEDSYVSIQRLETHSKGRYANLSGSIKNLRNPKVDLQVHLPELDTPFLSAFAKVPDGLYLPHSTWKVRFMVGDNYELRLNSLDVSADPVRLKASGWLKGGSDEKSGRITVTLAPTSLTGLAKLWTGFNRYGLAGIGEGKAVVSAIRNEKEEWSFAIDHVAANLRGASMTLKDKKLARLDASVDATENLSTIALKGKAANMTYYGTLISGLEFDARGEGGDVSVDAFNFKWNSSNIKARARIKNFSDPKEVRIESSIDKLDLDQAIAFINQRLAQAKPNPEKTETRAWSKKFKYAIPKAFPATAGRLRIGEVTTRANFNAANLELMWNLRNVSTGLNAVNGSVQVGFGPGRVTDIPAVQEVHKVLRVVFMPFVFMQKLNNMSVFSTATAYPKTLDFTRIFGQYGLKAGVVDVRLFHVDSPQLLAFGDGTVDFPNENISLHLLTRLTQTRDPLPEYLTDRKGRPSIAFWVEKDLNKPSLRVELEKMAEDAIEKNVADALKRSQKVYTPF